MAQEIGESREKWGWDVWHSAEDFASNVKNDDRPFYVVFFAKEDRARPGVFRQAFKAYYGRPPAMLGILVWFVDKKEGKFEFVPELSAPPDIPIDPSLLSTNPKDFAPSLGMKAQELNVLLS